jgi:hypothetical protein
MATLSNDQQGNIDFITLFGGKLVQRVPEGTEGATSRALTAGANEGKIVWEKHYTSVSGMITGGSIAVKEFANKKVKEIQVNLDDNILLQLPMNMLSGFAKPLPNVDITKEVKVSVYKNKAGKQGLNISQDGVQCEWAYTREEPNGLPEPLHDEELNEWDFRDPDKFLTIKVNEFFAQIGQAPSAPVVPEVAPATSDSEVDPFDV